MCTNALGGHGALLSTPSCPCSVRACTASMAQSAHSRDSARPPAARVTRKKTSTARCRCKGLPQQAALCTPGSDGRRRTLSHCAGSPAMTATRPSSCRCLAALSTNAPPDEPPARQTTVGCRRARPPSMQRVGSRAGLHERLWPAHPGRRQGSCSTPARAVSCARPRPPARTAGMAAGPGHGSLPGWRSCVRWRQQ